MDTNLKSFQEDWRLGKIQAENTYKYENGEYTLNRRPKEFSDVGEYLRRQGRFKHLTDDDIELVKQSRDRKWEFINKNFKTTG